MRRTMTESTPPVAVPATLNEYLNCHQCSCLTVEPTP